MGTVAEYASAATAMTLMAGASMASLSLWLPGRSFETVAYLLDGTLVHQDSESGGGVIKDGDTGG